MSGFVFSGVGGTTLSSDFGSSDDGVCDDVDTDGTCDDVDDCVGSFDACGVCNGDDTSCAGCDGVANCGLVDDA